MGRVRSPRSQLHRRWLVPVLAAVVALASLHAAAPDRARAAPTLTIGESAFLNWGDRWVAPSRIAPLIAATGAKAQRFAIAWASVQPQRGAWRWERVDAGVEAIRRAGIRPLIIVHSAPPWAAGPDCIGAQCPPRGDRLDAWAEFVGRVARRYGDALAIELLHGINWKGHWTTIGGPDPEYYARVFEAGARRIHRVRPGMPALIGGISSGLESDQLLGTMRPSTYLRRFYAALDRSVLRPADGLALRAFPSSEDLGGRPGRFRRQIAEVRAAVRAHDPRRSLWLTETGITTSGQRGVTLQEQSRAIEMVLDSLRRADDIAAITIHRLLEVPNPDDPSRAGWGIVRGAPSFAPKPAYCRLVSRAVGPLDRVGCVRAGHPRLGLGRLQRNRRNGTGRLIVRVPGPGTVTLVRTNRVRRVTRQAHRAGRVRLPIRPRGRARSRLREGARTSRRARARVRAIVAFRPDHGWPARIGRKVQLVRAPRG